MASKKAMHDALQVIVQTPHIFAYLNRTDPKALSQAYDALKPTVALPRCYKCEQAIRAQEYLDDPVTGARHIVCPTPKGWYA